ncbi:MAG: ABC transporter permease subunit [Chloroflexi bacterium]|nr:ABC transporter permease subunit [Chloroflexota bacterium]
MAELKENAQLKPVEIIPFWRDGRVIGVLAQIIFVILFFLAARWLLSNISTNIFRLGESQFICRDGSSSVRCAFDFMNSDAGFPISETVAPYVEQDSYWRAVGVSALNTIKVSIYGIILTTILGTVVGIARLSNNWLINNLAKWFIDLMRNTPLLLQLFFLYFVIILALPQVGSAIQLLNLPIFISQRGVNFPDLVFMSSFPVWLAFVVLAIIQVQVLWFLLGRYEEQTGYATNRGRWMLLSFLLIVGIGWVVSGSNSRNEAIMIPQRANVREFRDLAALVERRLAVNTVTDIDDELRVGSLTQEEVDAAALTLCTVEESPSEVNFTAQLRSAGIPYRVTRRAPRIDQAIDAYAGDACEIFVASRAIIAGERELLENPAVHRIVAIKETPLRLSLPHLEGFNFVGGTKLSSEFTALLVGLVLFTAAFVAEIVRAGIQSVPKGQTEAARALGLSESQRLRLVVMPQALRVILPPMISQYLNLTKNSSLGLAVAFPDLYRTVQTAINQSGRSVQLIVIMAATYLFFSLIISVILNWYNRQIALVER